MAGVALAEVQQCRMQCPRRARAPVQLRRLLAE